MCKIFTLFLFTWFFLVRLIYNWTQWISVIQTLPSILKIHRCYMLRMKDQDNMHGWGGKDRVIHLICLKSCCIMQNIILNDFARRTQLVWRKYPNFLFKYKHRYNYSKHIQGVLSEYCLKRLFSSDISS